jgi:hypothetical protein
MANDHQMGSEEVHFVVLVRGGNVGLARKDCHDFWISLMGVKRKFPSLGTFKLNDGNSLNSSKICGMGS